jgi:ATP-dependent Clp protease ATP-binding subunit ClpB
MQPTDPNKFTEQAWNAIVASQDVARSFRQQQLEVEHVMVAVLEQEDDDTSDQIFKQLQAEAQAIYQQLEDYAKRQPRLMAGTQLYLGRDLDRLLDRAESARKYWQDDFIGIDHLWMAFIEDDRVGRKLGRLYGIDSKNMESAIRSVRAGRQKRLAAAQEAEITAAPIHPPQTTQTTNTTATPGTATPGTANPGTANPGTANPTNSFSEDPQPKEGAAAAGKTFTREAPQAPLERYGRDLTQLAEEGKLDPVIGRDTEIRRVIQILSRRNKNNPVLIGEPGVGKTAIAEGLAQRIINGDVPESLKGRRLMSLDMGALIAGAKYRGEFEDRLRSVLQEVLKSQGHFILFIDEMHTVVGGGAGQQGSSMDAGNLLKPLLARGELRCIGATTIDEYRKSIEKDPALERRFQQIVVEQPSVEDSISILRGLKERYEMHHGVQITDSALVAAATLSNRYISDRFLPDKAIDLVDEAAAQLKMEITSKPQELEAIERRLNQLKMEQLSLESDEGLPSTGTGDSTQERLQKVTEELASLTARQAPLSAQWQSEKEVLEGLRDVKQREEDLKLRIAQAEREGDLETASKLQYNELPEAQSDRDTQEKKLLTLQANGSMLLREQVTENDIATIVARWTGIPVNRLMATERQKLLQLESYLHQRVIGQDVAAEAVAAAIRRARSGMKDLSKPIGSFLFMGPTGVGKTELARALAQALFDTEESIIRLDMSEYMDKTSIMRIIGAPPGYVGYEEGGQLTEAVRRKPYSVVLFDEVEKAHPDVFNLMLQVLDDGRITDSQGRTVDFRNTVIVMTSNIGSKLILEAGGDADRDEATHDKVINALRKHFRPEFLNRIDEIIIFHPLSKGELRQIVGIQIRRLQKLLADQKINLELTSDAQTFLAEVGYDPVYGARPLKRAIQRRLENPIATKLLENHFVPGDTIVVQVQERDQVSELGFIKKGELPAISEPTAVPKAAAISSPTAVVEPALAPEPAPVAEQPAAPTTAPALKAQAATAQAAQSARAQAARAQAVAQAATTPAKPIPATIVMPPAPPIEAAAAPGPESETAPDSVGYGAVSQMSQQGETQPAALDVVTETIDVPVNANWVDEDDTFDDDDFADD